MPITNGVVVTNAAEEAVAEELSPFEELFTTVVLVSPTDLQHLCCKVLINNK